MGAQVVEINHYDSGSSAHVGSSVICGILGVVCDAVFASKIISDVHVCVCMNRCMLWKIFSCANFFDLRNTPQTWYTVGIVLLCIFFKPRVFYQVPGDFSTIALAKLPF